MLKCLDYLRCSRVLVESGGGLPFSPTPFPSLRSGSGNHICDWLHWWLNARWPCESWQPHVEFYGSPWQTCTLFPGHMLPSNSSLSSSLFATPSSLPPFNLAANCLMVGRGPTDPHTHHWGSQYLWLSIWVSIWVGSGTAQKFQGG